MNIQQVELLVKSYILITDVISKETVKREYGIVFHVISHIKMQPTQWRYQKI